MTSQAKDAGVSVSIITIEGQECKLEQLSTVADNTGGDIERVNPLEVYFYERLLCPYFFILYLALGYKYTCTAKLYPRISTLVTPTS